MIMKKSIILSVGIFAAGAFLLSAHVAFSKTYRNRDGTPMNVGKCTLVSKRSEANASRVYTKSPSRARAINAQYRKWWDRNASCSELQFHINHKTSISRLTQWLRNALAKRQQKSTETHFGVHLGSLTPADATHLLTELGNDILVRNGGPVARDDYGWKNVKNSSQIPLCQQNCDSTRSSCACNAGDFYYSTPASRTSLPTLDAKQFLNINVNRYDTTAPTIRADLIAAYPSGHEQSYLQFLDHLLQGYKNTVKYWEIENEVDGAIFWAGTPEDYANLVALGSNEIRKNCSGCKVSISFSSPTITPKRSEMTDRWFAALGGVCSSFDIIDAHYLSVNFITQGTLDRWKQTCPGKEFFSTETGIPDNTKKGQTSSAGGSSEKQATDLVKYNTRLFAEGYDKIFWYLIDTDYGTGDLFLHNALIDESGAKKTAFTAYKTMIKQVDHFTVLTKIADGQYRYDFTGKKSVYVLWCDSGTCTLPSAITGTVTVTDHLGASREMNASQVTMTDAPVYVQEN